jgi:putative inorganic carbon (HCO3(-)) transporter
MLPPAQYAPAAMVISGCLFCVSIILFRFLRYPTPEEYRSVLSPLGIIFVGGVTAFLTIVFSLFFGLDQAILATACALGVALSLVHPLCGITLLISVLLLRPWEFLPTNESIAILPKLFSLLSILSWLIYHTRRNDFSLYWNQLATLLTTYLAWTLLSIIGSGGGTAGLSFFFERFYPVIFLWFAALHCVTTDHEVEALLKSTYLSLVSILVNAILFTNSLNPNQSIFTTRLQGLGYFGNSNDLAAIGVIALPLILFPSKQLTKKRSLRIIPVTFIINTILTFVTLSAIWLTKSRGALIALSAMVFAYSIFTIRSTLIRFLMPVIIICITMVAVQFIERDAEDLLLSKQSRLYFAIAGLQMAKANPIFGVGMGNFEKEYEKYALVRIEHGERSAHSSWIIPLAEGSILGLLLFCAFIGYGGVLAWKLRSQYPGITLAFIGYVIVMSFLSHTYLILPYLLVAIISLAARAARTLPNSANKSLKVKSI